MHVENIVTTTNQFNNPRGSIGTSLLIHCCLPFFFKLTIGNMSATYRPVIKRQNVFLSFFAEAGYNHNNNNWRKKKKKKKKNCRNNKWRRVGIALDTEIKSGAVWPNNEDQPRKKSFRLLLLSSTDKPADRNDFQNEKTTVLLRVVCILSSKQFHQQQTRHHHFA